MIGGSGSGKTNALLNLIKDLSEPEYQFLIEKCENVGIKHLSNLNVHLLSVQALWMMFTKTLMSLT